MFVEQNVRIVPLTRQLCEEINGLPAWKGERPLKPNRVRALAAKFERGEFHSPVWATVWKRGERHRINGQHSSEMLKSRNGDFPKDMQAVIYEFAASDDQDVASLFNQFDSRVSARTAGEVVNAHKSVHEAMDEIAPTYINKMLGGIVAYHSDGVITRVSDDRRGSLIHEHDEFIVWAHPFSKHRMLRSTGIMAAIYATYRRDAEDAHHFWSLVSSGAHPDTDNATRSLERFLRSEADSKTSTGKRKWGTRALYCKGVHAWNAYRQCKTTALKYHADSGIPRAI